MSSNALQNDTQPEKSSNLLESLRRLPWFPAVTILLLVIFSVEMFLSVRTESQTFDEPAHLYSGYAYWLRSDFGVNPEHPPLVKLVAALPLLKDHPRFNEPLDVYFRMASGIGGLFLLLPPGSDVLLGHARTAVSALAVLLALLVVFAGSEMFGRATALFALALLVFDPLILAHGPLVTTDVGAACFIFATVYAFYRYVKRPTIIRLALCGAAAGLALATKHSALFVFPILLLLAVTEIAFTPPSSSPASASIVPQSRGRYAIRLGVSLLVIGIISVTVLWSFYIFRYEARPNGKTITPPPDVYLQQLHHPVEAKAIGFAERHHLLPESYLFGLTDIIAVCRDGRVMTVLGHAYPNGRWFYFPAAMLIKCTIGFLCLLLLAPFAHIVWHAERRREILFVVVPPLAYFAWAMTSKLDIGIRHIMPIFPFLFLFAAASAISLARRSRAWAWAVSVLLFLHAASSLHAAPDYLPYSNEAFGGTQNTWRVLSDSNVGWGGGLKALSAYIRDNHIQNCWFAYSAVPEPATFGIPCKRLPTFFGFLADQGQQQPVPEQIEGPVFISSEEADGSTWGPQDLNPYQQFYPIHPTKIIAGEILRYDGVFSIPRIASFSHTIVAMGIDPRKSAAPGSVAQAQAAVALDPDSLLAHEALMYACAAHGQKDVALREYQVALRIFNTVHADFKNDEFPPQDPYSAPH